MPPVAVEPGVAQLFVDDAMVAEAEGVWRSLHHPLKYEGNPLLKPDRPWEGYLVLQPGTVIYDPEAEIFKLWYNTQPTRANPHAGSHLCYATSRDGLHWDKPELGLIEHNGSAANNIVLSGVDWTHCVLEDESDPDPERRYKLAYWGTPPRAAFPAGDASRLVQAVPGRQTVPPVSASRFRPTASGGGSTRIIPSCPPGGPPATRSA